MKMNLIAQEDRADEEDDDIHPAISLLDAIQDRPIETGAAITDKCVKMPPNAALTRRP